jgi:hypothetical protein
MISWATALALLVEPSKAWGGNVHAEISDESLRTHLYRTSCDSTKLISGDVDVTLMVYQDVRSYVPQVFSKFI